MKLRRLISKRDNGVWIYLNYDADVAMFTIEIYRREGEEGSSEFLSLKDFLTNAEPDDADKLNEFVYMMMT